MANPTTIKAPTYPQRVTLAAESVAQYLHLDDPKRVSAALAEIVAEEVVRNPSFASRVRTRYEELAPSKRRRGGSTRITDPKPPKTKRTLVPLKIVETGDVNIGAALDPYWLYEVYGADQLADALDEYTVASLKEAVEFVQERHPGTKPTNKGHREPIIEYVVRYVLADGKSR
jgi:hypothetical protein